MNNNLRNLEKDLRAFAKRNQNVTYTKGLLMTFLITGTISLSSWGAIDTTQVARQGVYTAITDMRQTFSQARRENAKLLKDSNLELIQLMEQGDQVVKSPWSSWQFGVNTYIGENKGTYKGHGDKKKDEYYGRESKFSSITNKKGQAMYGYGATVLSTENTIENPSEIEVDATITPKNIIKSAPSFTLTPPAGGLPPFNPLVVSAPVINPKVVTISQVPNAPSTDVAYQDVPQDKYGFNKDNVLITNALISQLEVTGGTFNNYFIGATNPLLYDFTGATEVGGYTPTGGATTLPAVDSGSSAGTNAFYALSGKALVTLPNTITVNVVGNNNGGSLNSIYYMGNHMGAGTPESKLVHESNTNIYGNKIAVVNIDNVTSTGSVTFVNNGNVTGYAQTGSFTDTTGTQLQGATPGNHIFGAYSYGNAGVDTIENGANGKVIFYAPESVGWAYTARSNQLIKRSSINNGVMQLFGKNSLGIATDGDTSVDQMSYADIQLNKPIEIYGDESVGASFLTEANDAVSTNFLNSKFNIQIGGAALTAQDATYGDTKGDTTKVENAVGLNFDFTIFNNGFTNHDINDYKISLEDNSKNSIAIRAGNAKLTFNDSATSGVTIGGLKNIGYLSDGATNNKLIYNNTTNNFKVTGDEAILFATQNGGNLEVNNALTLVDASNKHLVTGDGFTLAYSKDGGSKIDLKSGVTGEIKGDESILYYAENEGKISITESAVTQPATTVNATGLTIVNNTALGTPKVVLSGNDAVGFYALNGGEIEAENTNIKLTDGLVGAFSNGSSASGNLSKINLKNSIIDYSGNGYSVYSQNGGKIDLSGSTIVLRGNSVGLQGSSLSDITTNTNTRIVVMSNDAIPFEFKNKGTVNLTTMDTDLGIAATGIQIISGENGGTTYTEYKKAFADGIADYNIDTNIDKKLGADIINEATDSFQFTKRYLVQRANLNLKAGKTVDAVLSTAEEAAIGASSVVGLDISSSSYASSNAETGINLEASSTVNADRTDAGNGAVGLYTNYGKIDTDASSTINVEKGANTVNDSGVGIYTVNGSEVDSKGTINVGGNKSIGILGVAYREDITTGTPIVNEFVSSTGVVAPGQGTSKVVNSGQINLDGNNATGIYVKNNNATGTNTTTTALNTGAGAINLAGNNSIGMLGDKATLTNDAKINLNGQESVGMYANNGSVILNDTNGVINLATSTVGLNPNVGIFTDDATTTIENKGKIIGGDNTYGIYSQGATVTTRNGSEIEVGESGVGIYSTGSAINLDNGSKIKVGGTEAVGVFVTGNSTIVGNADMTIGDSSFGYVVKPTSATTGTTLTTSATNPITLGNDAVYVYSADTLGTVTNNTVINSTGNNNYGIYSASNVQNNADINFGSGLGNVAIYTTDGATATNGVLGSATNPTITVSGSGMLGGTQVYGIGMAAGYYDGTVTRYTGKVVNHGTINVGQTGGIGMYAVGSGSEAVNYGDINLTGANSVGMYLDRGAIGTNWGTITTGPTASNGGIIGVVATNGAIIKNYGQIIIDGTDNKAVYLAHASSHYEDTDTATGTVGTITTTNGAEGVKRKTVSDTGKVVGGVQIITPPSVSSTVVNINGVPTPIVNVDTDATATNPSATIATVGATQVLDLATLGLTGTSTTEVLPGIGMYVDTSGVQFTNPIHNLGALTGLGRVDLIFGNEASKYTDSKVIQLGNNILDPYNLALSSLTGASSLKIGLSSSNLTWLATGVQNPGTGLLDSVYLVKIPYTSFAVSGDTNTYNFLDGLEQSYVSSGNSRMSQLFSKLNSLNKNEAHILAQAVDQMKGHQYANVQQRINATGNKIDKEIDYLFDEWETKSKESNKIKLFGIYDQYKTDSAGIINWASDGYGVAYLHEDETVKLGDTTGWYAGAIHNRFRFKDMGGSKENTTMLKAGIFKSTAFDDNNSLNWTISGEGFVSRSEMDRRFWVVDDVFSASSNYTSYGLGLKNEISKTFRTSPKTSIKPYASLDMEYGRFSNISEKNGEVQLEVKGNDYYSIQPEIGMEFKYRTPFAKRSIFITKLNVAYENELGKIGDVRNQARVKGTTANWYDLRGEKEDRRGNVKTDLNIGIENGRVGFTLNAGYDTKGNNIRGGIGLRAIY